MPCFVYKLCIQLKGGKFKVKVWADICLRPRQQSLVNKISREMRKGKKKQGNWGRQKMVKRGLGRRPTVGLYWKTRQKRVLIVSTNLCLQRFDKFWMWSAGNRKRKLCEFAETSMEKLVKSPWANLCFGGFLTFGTTVGQRGSCWHGFTKKNLKWHICITNDDSYCAHGHTRTNRCVNGYICMYVCSM